MGSFLLDVQVGHVDGHLVPVHGGVHLEEETVGAFVNPAVDILRKTMGMAITTNPALFPVAGLHTRQGFNHHRTELISCAIACGLAIRTSLILLALVALVSVVAHNRPDLSDPR